MTSFVKRSNTVPSNLYMVKGKLIFIMVLSVSPLPDPGQIEKLNKSPYYQS